MKNKIFSLLTALLTVMSLTTACDDWEPGTQQFPSNTGGVNLKGMAVNVDSQTRPSGRATVETGSFLVQIIDKATSETAVYDGAKCEWTFSQMPEVMTLPVGEYTVNVKSHEPLKAEWDNPCYEGSKDFEIRNGEITAIGTVTATLASIKVTVKYSDKLAQAMSADSHVDVVAGQDAQLTWSATETRDGYFAAVEGSTTLVATFSGSLSGNPVSTLKEFTDVAKGNHYIITFDLSTGPEIPGETGDINPTGITVDGSIEESDENGDIDPSDDPESGDRPDKEDWGNDPTDPTDPNDPNDPNDPTELFTLKATGMSLTEVNDAVDGGTYVLNIVSANPLTKLNVEIISGYLTNEFLQSVGLGANFDLANPGAFGPALEGMGFPIGDQVAGKKDVNFNLTPFIPLLNLSPEPQVHTFRLTVADDQNNEKTVDLKFQSF